MNSMAQIVPEEKGIGGCDQLEAARTWNDKKKIGDELT